MRCKQEEFVKDQYFHFYNHAIGDELLFREDEDYIWFLNKFKIVLQKYPASIFAYCLMPNHFHFLIRQDSEKPIYKIFNDLNNPYVKHYNYKYKRVGRLYRDSLQHIRVYKENYLIHLCQYIHYNPVKAGIVNRAENWRYSNFLEWIGARNGDLFDVELLKAYFGDSKDHQNEIQAFEKYIKEKEFTKLLLEKE